jgi:exosome complex RNA-binding protein Csl4
MDEKSTFELLKQNFRTEALKASESLVEDIKPGQISKPRRKNKLKYKTPEKPAGTICKRCPNCRTKLYSIIPTKGTHYCWKCEKKLKLVHIAEECYCSYNLMLKVADDQ